MKQFLATDGMKLNDTFEKKTEVVEIVQGSGFIREGDQFNTYAQFDRIYGEMAGVRLNARQRVENFLARIGLCFIEQDNKKTIVKIGDEVGEMLYDFYLQNDEPAISTFTATWRGENREKVNQFLRDKPWERVEGRLKYSKYGFSVGTASAIFCAMPETRLFEITKADFKVNLPEGSLWTVDRIYKIVGNSEPKRADITCICGKKVEMYQVKHLENGSLGCQSCSKRTTDFDAFYQSVADEKYTIVKDFQDTRPTALSRITLQCSDKTHQPYSTYQNKWTNLGRRCPACSKNHVGEQKTREFLQSKGVLFKEQVRFDNLIGVGGKELSYDFQIELNGKTILLEIDGEQHFKSVEAWGGEAKLQRNIEHDRLKDDFAVKKGLHLVRIQNVDRDYDFILNSLEAILNGSETNHYGSLYQERD